ncbi:unnamed protein product [Lepeophtheirus salmonis]|uniref:(salmon louse) hypothetical protein n=1 Tax=Lepeophtheirus salmonis TaxID=72036 RepID=A0A7R8CAR2_LEPSM|nr:unnamed protein product [Lepeophtheirus salmonis]CAF2753721.1 unnamed protein product [Lepeophtheirus salmonis]
MAKRETTLTRKKLTSQSLSHPPIKEYAEIHTSHQYAVSENGQYDSPEDDLDDQRRIRSTPTPSEKVSRWHRDIFLVSSPTDGEDGSTTNGNNVNKYKESPASHANHPRQCLCQSCMEEYGTYKLYNKILQNKEESEKKVLRQEGRLDLSETESMGRKLYTVKRRVGSAMSVRKLIDLLAVQGNLFRFNV